MSQLSIQKANVRCIQDGYSDNVFELAYISDGFGHRTYLPVFNICDNGSGSKKCTECLKQLNKFLKDNPDFDFRKTI